MTEELLACQRRGLVGTGRKRHLPGFPAIELGRLERLHIVDGFGQPLLQFLEGLFGSGVDGTSLPVRRAQPFIAKSPTNWTCLLSGSISG